MWISYLRLGIPELSPQPIKILQQLQSWGHTHCPADLIENFFMDNKKDLAYLISDEGKRAIVETIIDGIERCVLTLVSG